MLRPSPRHAGFTLIELLIVVVILSTLAAIVVPQFASSSDSAKVAAAKSSLNGIRSALEVYRTDNSDYPLAGSGYTVCAGLTKATVSADQLYQTLSFYNNGSNEICNTKDNHPFGPYLRAKKFPDNPLESSNTVEVSNGNTLGLTASADNSNGVWKYQPATGEFIINESKYENE